MIWHLGLATLYTLSTLFITVAYLRSWMLKVIHGYKQNVYKYISGESNGYNV